MPLRISTKTMTNREIKSVLMDSPLFYHLPKEEQKELIENINKILKEKGEKHKKAPSIFKIKVNINNPILIFMLNKILELQRCFQGGKAA